MSFNFSDFWNRAFEEGSSLQDFFNEEAERERNELEIILSERQRRIAVISQTPFKNGALFGFRNVTRPIHWKYDSHSTFFEYIFPTPLCTIEECFIELCNDKLKNENYIKVSEKQNGEIFFQDLNKKHLQGDIRPIIVNEAFIYRKKTWCKGNHSPIERLRLLLPELEKNILPEHRVAINDIYHNRTFTSFKEIASLYSKHLYDLLRNSNISIPLYDDPINRNVVAQSAFVLRECSR